MVNFMPQGKISRYLLDRRLGGPHIQPGRSGEEKNSEPPPGSEPPDADSPARNQSLYLLSYTGSTLHSYDKKNSYIENI
jgi:hypothetical protein